MAYEAIIFDLDGTAITNAQDALPSDTLVETLRSAESSYKLCAATGRPMSNARRILGALELVDPCVVSAGTKIVDPQSEEVLWEYDIEPGAVQQVLEVCRAYPYELLLRDELIGEGGTANSRAVVEPVNVMYLMQCGVGDAAEVMSNLAKIPTISASGVTSWIGGGVDIHITHRQATKEHAIGASRNNGRP
jgi:hydroxymethylpyrimidine pyrophosphatase-like HAD family hydrolase